MAAAQADREPQNHERGEAHELNWRDVASTASRPDRTARLMRQLHDHIVAPRLHDRYRP